MNLLQVAKTFATEDMALAYWIMTRWPTAFAAWLAIIQSLGDHHKGQDWQGSRSFQVCQVRTSLLRYRCTLFHDSHLPLTKWFAAIALMVEAKKGVSANQVARHIGVSTRQRGILPSHPQRYERNRIAILGGPGKVVEVDETFIGGKSSGKGKHPKIAVLGIAERGGRVHLQSIPNTTALAIHPILKDRIDPDTDKVSTDAAVR